jgi:hypothetical protein
VTERSFPSESKVLAAVTETAFGAIDSTAPTAGTVETMVFASAVLGPKAVRAIKTTIATSGVEKLRNRVGIFDPSNVANPCGLEPILSPL